MANVEKVCKVCGSVFSVWPSRADTAVVCSRACLDKMTAERYKAARVKKTCPICAKEFEVPKCHDERSVCCSIRCANKMPSRKRLKGASNPTWNGGKTDHSDGYLYLSVEDHPFSSTGKYVFEHRLILEAVMRKKARNHPFLVEIDGQMYLRPEIEVHHLDGVKRNNQIENLLACTASAHQAIHNRGLPVKGSVWPEDVIGESLIPYQVECTCKTCGAKFFKKRSAVSKGSGKYCNRTCYEASRNKPVKK